jgi:uncharacterized protein YcbX
MAERHLDPEAFDEDALDDDRLDGGRVEGIFLFPKRRAAARAVAQVEARPGGLLGDRRRSLTRQVTLLTVEGWTAAVRQIAADAPASARRANLVVSGVDLSRAMGRRLRVGGAVLRVGGENTPCRRMDEVAPGLRAALAPDVRAGVFATVERGGAVRVGDRVAPL